jgi:hypothetical protein
MFHWKKNLAVDALLGVVALAICCVLPFEQKPQSMNKRFVLSRDQITDFSRAANEGNGDAAMRLYEHYSFGINDMPSSRPFLIQAYNAGNPRAVMSVRNLAKKGHVAPEVLLNSREVPCAQEASAPVQNSSK